MTPSSYAGLTEFRCVGPFRGGRVVAVAGDRRAPYTFYFGAVCGGIWKTNDAGQYWENVSDGYLSAASIGALEVAPADPNVIYAGSGESTIRIDVSIGDGIYKSTDAGRSWAQIGLKETRQIAKIRSHPQNADIVYVAAFGHAFGANPERGIYRSQDGGASWELVLHVSDKAGAIDISIDANNPRILYAAFWEAYRSFWQISSGGEGSGIWRSTDGGDSWHEISRKPGLPKGLLGKIGIASSPAQPGRLWAIIENQPDGGIYRSDDYGDTWVLGSKDNRLISRAWYYMHLTADPRDANTVYVNNLSLWKSNDGGHNFSEITTPHGDNHDLWINPDNTSIMVQGNDGGCCVSLNEGLSWSTIYNQPTGQFYHLDTDDRQPYYIYGTQQDNSSLRVPSRSRYSSITWEDCDLIGSGESGYIAVHPEHEDIVYVGAIGSSPGGGNSLQRYDHRRQQIRLISTWPRSSSGLGAQADKYRFAWTYPIVFSPHDSQTIYIGGNQILRSQDEGQSWQEISPDLSKADPQTLGPSGGPINRDAVGAEHYATVYTLAESRHAPGEIWAGSDDGLLHITRDGGASWADITPPDLGEWTMFTMIELSRHAPGCAYLTATRYKMDDYAPYVLKTEDYGRSWQHITQGIAPDHFCRVIREDDQQRGLLYLGTEFGLYISCDDGASWQRFQLNLPISPIYDMQIKGQNLVIATHGRAFWILDDLSLLRQASALDAPPAAPLLLQPSPSQRLLPKVFEGMFEGGEGKQYMSTLGLVAPYIKEKSPEHSVKHRFLDSGTNPPKGVLLTYFLPEAASETISLRIEDATGAELRTFHSIHADEVEKAAGTRDDDSPDELRIPSAAGWNRFLWDMRYPDALRVIPHKDNQQGYIAGPIALPGRYRATLSVGDARPAVDFEIVPERGIDASPEDMQAQFELLLRIRDKVSATHKRINQMRDLRAQLQGWQTRLRGLDTAASIADAAKLLAQEVLTIEKKLMIPDTRAGWLDAMNHGDRLAEQLKSLTFNVALGDYRPTDYEQDAYTEIAGDIDSVADEFQDLVDGNLAEFNSMLSLAGFGKVTLLPG